MKTIKNFICQKEAEACLGEGPAPSPLQPLPGDKKLSSSPAQPSHSTTLISAGYSLNAMDLGKLHHEMKVMEKDMKLFQHEIMETLNKLEGTLSYLIDVMVRLENKSRDAESKLRGKSCREPAQNKVLTPHLPAEKLLLKKHSTLEEMFFQNSAQLELIVQKWAKEAQPVVAIKKRENEHPRTPS